MMKTGKFYKIEFYSTLTQLIAQEDVAALFTLFSQNVFLLVSHILFFV